MLDIWKKGFSVAYANPLCRLSIMFVVVVRPHPSMLLLCNIKMKMNDRKIQYLSWCMFLVYVFLRRQYTLRRKVEKECRKKCMLVGV